MAENMTRTKNKQKLWVKENKETFPRKEIVETLQNSRSKNFCLFFAGVNFSAILIFYLIW